MERASTFLIILLFILITVIAGSITYSSYTKIQETETQALNDQIDNLESQVTKLHNKSNALSSPNNPISVVTNFYRSYEDYKKTTDQNLSQSPYLTSQFVNSFQINSAKPENQEINLISCAQDTPPNRTVALISATKNTAKVKVKSNFTPPINIKVNLIKNNDTWQISNISCPTS